MEDRNDIDDNNIDEIENEEYEGTNNSTIYPYNSLNQRDIEIAQQENEDLIEKRNQRRMRTINYSTNTYNSNWQEEENDEGENKQNQLREQNKKDEEQSDEIKRKKLSEEQANQKAKEKEKQKKEEEEEEEKSTKRKLTLLLMIIKVVVIIILILLPIIIIIVLITMLISAIGGGYKNRNNSSDGSSDSISGIGSYYEGESSDYSNMEVAYTREDGSTTTYTVDELTQRIVYSKTGDDYSIELYKTYAVLIRTNIISDEDGIIDSSEYSIKEIEESKSQELITTATKETENQYFVDEEFKIIKVDFKNNDCTDCTLTDGISLKLANSLIEDNNYNYIEVLRAFYGENTTSKPTNTFSESNISLEIKDTSKAKYLNKPIDEFLNNNGSSLQQLNNYITENVEPIYGTREAVATAAVALVNFLHDGFNIKLPYYWGGKYVGIGLSSKFGTYHPVRLGAKIYNYVSFDCSGFAEWSVYNGGFKDPGTGTEHFDNYFKDRCDITSPSCIGNVGDLINYRSFGRGHVQVIVGVDRANELYYIAESSTNGVVVTTRQMHKGKLGATVYVLNMSNYYENNVRKKSS